MHARVSVARVLLLHIDVERASVRRVVIVIVRWMLLALAPALAFLGYRLHRGRVDPVVSAEEAVLARQCVALQALVAAGERGGLLDFGQVLVVVDQGLVQDILRAAMPIEGPVGGFQVRIESAQSSFGDGMALIQLIGKATLVRKAVTADLRVYGGLEVVSMDPATGLLRCQVRVFAVEADRADVLGIDEPVRGLAEALSQGGLAALLRFVEIPVRIDDHLTLPAVSSGRLRIREASVPIRAEVAEVRVFAGKIWVALVERRSTPTETASATQGAPQ